MALRLSKDLTLNTSGDYVSEIAYFTMAFRKSRVKTLGICLVLILVFEARSMHLQNLVI